MPGSTPEYPRVARSTPECPRVPLPLLGCSYPKRLMASLPFPTLLHSVCATTLPTSSTLLQRVPLSVRVRREYSQRTLAVRRGTPAHLGVLFRILEGTRLVRYMLHANIAQTRPLSKGTADDGALQLNKRAHPCCDESAHPCCDGWAHPCCDEWARPASATARACASHRRTTASAELQRHIMDSDRQFPGGRAV